MPKGGIRVGSGRKPLHDGITSRELAKSAIVAKFGSIEAGLQSLLDSEEPVLLKFVYEHAIGKAKDVIEHSGEIAGTPQIILNFPKGD